MGVVVLEVSKEVKFALELRMLLEALNRFGIRYS